jgi:hypothetical protein
VYYMSRRMGAVYSIRYPKLLLPAADASVSSGARNTNFGGQTELNVLRTIDDAALNVNHVSYLRFDLSGIAPVPPRSARLQLYVGANSSPAGATVNLGIYAVPNKGWTESGLTWNSAPGLNPKTGMSMGKRIGTFSVPTTAGKVTLDLTGFVKEYWGNVVTIQLINPVRDNIFLSFHSKENATEKPQLILDF